MARTGGTTITTGRSAAAIQSIRLPGLLEVGQKTSNFPAVNAGIQVLSRRHQALNLHCPRLDGAVHGNEDLDVESEKGPKAKVEWLLGGRRVVAITFVSHLQPMNMAEAADSVQIVANVAKILPGGRVRVY
ncbi:hypothetical protein ST47_g8409 [Ascochyta rabiei]|uniref:Uncharacterized protein n=2 Tax=Didymella rabiei TaxID=5454 RepID=A0A162YYI0_DIDRA|nr:hypothetical protein ST47_g8409 [Ascochyta rabiei]